MNFFIYLFLFLIIFNNNSLGYQKSETGEFYELEIQNTMLELLLDSISIEIENCEVYNDAETYLLYLNYVNDSTINCFIAVSYKIFTIKDIQGIYKKNKKFIVRGDKCVFKYFDYKKPLTKISLSNYPFMDPTDFPSWTFHLIKNKIVLKNVMHFRC